jgi:ribose transport system substrate-binding protein
MMKISKLTLLLLIISMGALSFAACSTQGPADEPAKTNEQTEEEPSQSGEADEASTPDNLVVGYNAFSDTVDFSRSITKNMEENAESLKAELLYANSDGDASVASKNAETFLVQGAKYVVDSSWAIGATQAVADICKAKGIPCISIDTMVDDVYFMGANNLEAGKVAGAAAAEYINENWDGQLEYLVLSWNVNAGEEVKKRLSGIADAISEAGIEIPEENIVWVDPQSADATVESKQIATDFLTAHPDAKRVVFGTQNDQGALGVLSAIQTAKRDDDCIIVSHGCDGPNFDNLRNKEPNSWLGSVAYFPEKYGDVIFQIINDLEAGKDVPRETYMPHVFIDKDTIAEYYPE